MYNAHLSYKVDLSWTKIISLGTIARLVFILAFIIDVKVVGTDASFLAISQGFYLCNSHYSYNESIRSCLGLHQLL